MHHLQIILNVTILLLNLTGLSYGGQDSTSTLVQQIVLGGGGVNIDEISAEQRSELIPALKQVLNSNTDPYPKSSISNALLALNDDQTIYNIVNQYHSDNGGPAEGALSLQGREGVISALGPDLSLPASVQKAPGGDVFYLPTREYSASIIMRSLSRSTEFPPATRAWANNTHAESNSKLWKLVNQWWEHNKDAILTHRYADATWLPATGESSREDSAPQVSVPQTLPSPQASDNIKASAADSPTSIGWVVAVAIALVLATVAAGALAFRLLRK